MKNFEILLREGSKATRDYLEEKKQEEFWDSDVQKGYLKRPQDEQGLLGHNAEQELVKKIEEATLAQGVIAKVLSGTHYRGRAGQEY